MLKHNLLLKPRSHLQGEEQTIPETEADLVCVVSVARLQRVQSKIKPPAASTAIGTGFRFRSAGQPLIVHEKSLVYIHAVGQCVGFVRQCVRRRKRRADRRFYTFALA